MLFVSPVFYHELNFVFLTSNHNILIIFSIFFLQLQPPLSDTNYLYELDKITQKIISDITSARKIGIMGSVPVQGTAVKVDVPDQMNAAQLNRLRRQFLTYSKMHSTSTTLDKVPQLFVQYLNSNFNK